MAEESDVDGYEGETLSKSILPVAKKPLKEGVSPASGEEYLLMVRSQTRKVPRVVIATAPPSKQDSNVTLPQKYQYHFANGIEDAKDQKPEQDWQSAFMERYRHLRMDLEERERAPKPLQKLPSINDPDAWYSMLYKSQTSEHAPYLSPTWMLLDSLDQHAIFNLLSHFPSWASDDLLKDHEAQWIFALLLKVDTVMTPEQMSILRDICRKCRVIKSRSQDQPASQASTNMIITIVSQYFGQADLG